MTDPSFDETDWIARLACALEDVVANARPSYSPLPPEMMRSGLGAEYWNTLHRGYRTLAARAKHDAKAAPISPPMSSRDASSTFPTNPSRFQRRAIQTRPCLCVVSNTAQVSERSRKGENAVGRAEDVRKTRSIRFSDSEWEEVKRAALAHDIAAAEFVRERILALARNPESAGSGPVPPSMAPLIERMFRYTWFLATEKRDAMLREGRQKELDALVAEARAFQESLRGDAPD